MKKRGIRVVIGGDYGFARTPQGENARDIEHFVRHLGYSPSEALVCATRYGAELMGLGGEAGQVREGCLAARLTSSIAVRWSDGGCTRLSDGRSPTSSFPWQAGTQGQSTRLVPAHE